MLFSRALKLPKAQLERLREEWNAACSTAPVASSELQKILDVPETRILSHLADPARDVISFPPVDLLEFQLTRDAEVNGEPVARLIRILKTDEEVRQLDQYERKLLSDMLLYARHSSPDNALRVVTQMAKDSG